MFVTASDDQTVRLWDVASKVNTKFVIINSIGRAIRFQLASSVCTYCLVTECEIRTINYGPSFSPSIYGPRAKRAGHNP